MADPPDDVSFEMSEDGCTLNVKRHTERGLETATTHWTFDPTPELIYKAIHGVTKFRELERGEKIRARKFAGVIFMVNTGPPTWWWPRCKIKLGGVWGVHVGWFNGAVSIWRPKARASQ